MNESIKRQIADITERVDRLAPCGTFLLVEMPNGNQVEKTARDWWMHRHEWKWITTTRIDPKGWPPFVLYLAKTYDESYQEALENGSIRHVDTIVENGRYKDIETYLDAEYFKNERDEWLKKFFGEVLP